MESINRTAADAQAEGGEQTREMAPSAPACAHSSQAGTGEAAANPQEEDAAQKAAREAAAKAEALRKQRAEAAAREYRRRYFAYYDDVKNHGDGRLKNIEW